MNTGAGGAGGGGGGASFLLGVSRSSFHGFATSELATLDDSLPAFGTNALPAGTILSGGPKGAFGFIT